MANKKIADINWRNDRITRDFIADHPELLGSLKKIKASDLGTASTYCKDWNNPFITEILTRSGHYDKWQQATSDKEKRQILDKACSHFGFILG